MAVSARIVTNVHSYSLCWCLCIACKHVSHTICDAFVNIEFLVVMMSIIYELGLCIYNTVYILPLDMYNFLYAVQLRRNTNWLYIIMHFKFRVKRPSFVMLLPIAAKMLKVVLNKYGLFYIDQCLLLHVPILSKLTWPSKLAHIHNHLTTYA